MQKLLASDGYGNHLDEAAVEEILAGLETSDEEGGSSSGEDDGDDGDMGNLDGGDFDEEAGEEDGDDDDGGGDEDDDDEEDEASSSEERSLFHFMIYYNLYDIIFYITLCIFIENSLASTREFSPS